jgi:hypothetical protein
MSQKSKCLEGGTVGLEVRGPLQYPSGFLFLPRLFHCANYLACKVSSHPRYYKRHVRITEQMYCRDVGVFLQPVADWSNLENISSTGLPTTRSLSHLQMVWLECGFTLPYQRCTRKSLCVGSGTLICSFKIMTMLNSSYV